MNIDLSLLTTQFITLLAVLDPLGHLTLFIAATGHFNAQQKRNAALISIGMAFVVLVLFGLGGQALLRAMGVSLLSFQVAGGLIMLIFAINMVLGAHTPAAAITEAAEHEGEIGAGSVLETAVYPLAVPVIAGPGALLSIVVLMDNTRHAAGERLQVVLALAAVLAILLATFLVGQHVSRFIGAGGANLLRRVMGMILAAIAVNLVLGAIASWLNLPAI